MTSSSIVLLPAFWIDPVVHERGAPLNRKDNKGSEKEDSGLYIPNTANNPFSNAGASLYPPYSLEHLLSRQVYNSLCKVSRLGRGDPSLP